MRKRIRQVWQRQIKLNIMSFICTKRSIRNLSYIRYCIRGLRRVPILYLTVNLYPFHMFCRACYILRSFCDVEDHRTGKCRLNLIKLHLHQSKFDLSACRARARLRTRTYNPNIPRTHQVYV